MINTKRVRPFYRLERLQLRLRMRRRKHTALHRGPAPQPAGRTERWSIDFVHDALANGPPFRVLTVVDQWSRQSPILEVASSMSGATVGQALDRVLPTTPTLRSVTLDHGTEFTSRALEDWAFQRAVQLDFTRPVKPVDNAFIESFNGRLRDECLNIHQFTSIEDMINDNWIVPADDNYSCRSFSGRHGRVRLIRREVGLVTDRQVQRLREQRMTGKTLATTAAARE